LSSALRVRGALSDLPLTVAETHKTDNGLVLRLQKSNRVVSAPLFNLVVKADRHITNKIEATWWKVLCLFGIGALHMAVFMMMKNVEPAVDQVSKSAAPLLVSIVAPPTPEVLPEPKEEPVIVPIVAKKPKVKPKLKPKKIVKKIVPVAKESQPLVEATAEPVTEDDSLEESLEIAAPEVMAAEAEADIDVIEEKIEPPKFGVAYLNNPAPTYPRFSRRLGEEGRVLLKVLVTTQGTPGAVAVEQSSGFERLDKAAIKAVEHWQFVPARKGSEILSAYVLVPVKFSLGS